MRNIVLFLAAFMIAGVCLAQSHTGSSLSAEEKKELKAQLEVILKDDQDLRLKTDSLEQYGWNSPQMMQHWSMIRYKDSVNLVKVSGILDTYGWLGAEDVGVDGNAAIFLVIQHADLNTQEKYLPLMREAVKTEKARARSLALLEDRILIRKGKKQIYGSQLAQDRENQESYVLPLEDPENVDKRRASVGLPPMSEYLKSWNLEWSVEEYNKAIDKRKSSQ